MAPSRERGGQGQAAGGRGGGRGPHGGGRGPNPNAAAVKKVQDNGNAPEKPIQHPQPSQGGSAPAAEPAPRPGPWGGPISWKDKLLTTKQEPAPSQPTPAAPAPKDSAAKPAANGPEAPKPSAPEASSGPAVAPPPPASGPRPYAAAVTAPVAAGNAEGGSDIQFGSFMEGEVAQGKEQPAAPQGPLPTAVPAAVEAVRQQSRQVIRTNSAPASANPAHEGPRDAVFVPHKVERTSQQQPQQSSRMATPIPEGAPVVQPNSVSTPPPPPPPEAVPVAVPPPGPAPMPMPAVPVPPPPAREPGPPQRQGPPPQTGPQERQQHARHDRQPHPAGPMPVANAGVVPMPPGGPGPSPHHGQPRHPQQQPHHMQMPPPPQGYGPGPAGHTPQPLHHHMPPQQQQPGGQPGGRRGGPAHQQQVPVQMAVQVPGGYPPAPYGMPSYAAQATQPIPMAQPHGYPAAMQHPQVAGPGAGQHGMAGHPQQYLTGSPSQFQQYMFSASPVMGGHMGAPPMAMPVMVPVAAHPHSHHHAPGAPHMLAGSPTMSVGFHVPAPQQHPPPQAGYGTAPNVPQPPPITIPIPPPGAGAGSAPNAPVAAAAQAAINATNAAAPVTAVPAVVPAAPPTQPPPPHPPTTVPAPAPAPLQGPGAGAVAGGSVSSAGLAAVAPGSAAQPKPVATPPPPPPQKKVLNIIDPKSHEKVVIGGAAGAGAGKGAEGGAVGAAAVVKPAAAPPAAPQRRPLVIKEPTVKAKPEPKAAAEAKQQPADASPSKAAEPAKSTEAPAQPAAAAAQQPAQPAAAAVSAPAPTVVAEAAGKAEEAPAAPAPSTSQAAVPAVEAAAPAVPAKEPASHKIDVADDEEVEASTSSTPATAAVPSEAAGPSGAPTAEEAAAASASGAASGSGSGDDSSAAGSSGAGAASRKKNLKQMIRDADAKGANNDLLSAFREPAPPPKAEAAEAAKGKEAEEAKAAAAPAAAPAPADQVTDHWEEEADKAAAGEASASVAGETDTRHRYSRDYLLAIGTRIVMPLMVPLDSYHQQNIGLDKPQDNTRIGAGLALGRTGSREAEWGRRDDRGRGGDFRGGDMRGDRGGGMGGDRRDRDGMRGGPGRGGPGGGMDRRGSANMDDGWQRRGPPPPPSPGGDMRGGGSRGMSRQGSGPTGGYGIGGPVNLHKTENRWQVGVSTAEDPEEEKKQKTFKGILNKLTPDNYDKLKQQILDVPITHQKTLEGFINQIFDKALIETTFSEMYANLCKEIHPSLPQFPSTDPNNQKPVDFRRLLLNKCQQEFEDGVAAMKKVKEREEHNKEEAEKEKQQQGKEKPAAAAAADNGKLEEGEIPSGSAAAATGAAASTDDARAKALAEAAEAERELKARRRMLGNIQFIGHLYKCGLLTERIIHSCIVQLLNDELSPRPDDIECLCKLLTTLGKQLEEQVNKKGTQNGNPLDVYFQRMERLRKSSNLDSRIKFAIQDVLDLRAAKWVSRRKVEGPKRIEDVHREAQLQLAAQASRDREERYAQRGPGGRGGPGMGGRDAPPPPGRFGGPASQDEARLMGRGEVARPLRGPAMERQASAEVNLRPSSFLTGKRTGSPAQPGGVIAAAAASAREAAAAAARVQPSVPAPPPPAREERAAPPPPAGMSEEAAQKKGVSWVKDLYEVKEKAAAAESLASLKAAGTPMGVVLASAVREAFEVRGIEPEKRLDLLKEVLVEQLTSTEGVLNSSMLEDAFGRFMSELDTWVEDNPKAAGVASKTIGQLAAQGHVSLGPCLRPILDAKGSSGGDDDGGSGLPPLVESGVAGHDILGNVLQAASDAGGMDKAAELWRASGLEAARFFDMPEDVETLSGKFAFLSG